MDCPGAHYTVLAVNSIHDPHPPPTPRPAFPSARMTGIFITDIFITEYTGSTFRNTHATLPVTSSLLRTFNWEKNQPYIAHRVKAIVKEGFWT